MLDDFRQQAGDALLDEAAENAAQAQKPESARRFLGMNPLQTFVISLLLLMLTCLLSSACLLASGKVVPF